MFLQNDHNPIGISSVDDSLEGAPGEERGVGEEAGAHVVVAVGWGPLDVAPLVVVVLLVAWDP